MSIKLTPFSAGCGAVVEDMQLATLGPEQLADLRQAFSEYGLLFFRNQNLSPENHLGFAKQFGNIVLNKFFTPVSNYPDIAEVRKEPTQEMNIGGGWHTDHSYDDEPAMGSILVARELPDSGGNTRFANLAAAYSGLPEELKYKVASLRAIHSNEHIYGKGGYYESTDQAMVAKGDRVGRATHPIVIQHPLSKKSILYVNPGHTIAIEGMDSTESKDLLDQLYAHVDQSEFTCNFDWHPGSVAFWDNRATWHFANNDYQGQRRLMHRITLAGCPLIAP
ncbi:MAG: TauD/TfdA dioxygenase family protein [Pseudomonadales bacterium]